MKFVGKTYAAFAAAAVLAASAQADEREELLKLKNTTVNLIDLLVEQGVLDKSKAKDLVKAAEDKAAAEARQQRAEELAAPAEVPDAEAEPLTPRGKKGKKQVRVGYVPDFVKEEIRNQVRNELKADVVKEVKAEAKKEQWGIPAALPGWISRIHPYFDMRLRFAADLYDSGNADYFDWLAINRIGSLSTAEARNDAYLNTSIDRIRLRERFRVGFDADITDSVRAGFRFATSNINNPVSNNQTLGNTGQSWDLAIDRAFLEYDFRSAAGNDWFSLYAGRIANPWVSTDVVFDPDLSFEGVAGTFRWRFNQDDPVVSAYHAPNPTGRMGINLGPQTPNTVFATLGAFPIQEVNFSSHDKWMFGGQLGADWLVFQDTRLKFAGSYYHYINTRAQRNPAESNQFDWTAPQFIQKGNTLVAITDASNRSDCNSGLRGSNNVCLVGLASDFEIFNATAMFDYAGFAPTHILLTADYAHNFGFDRNRILREFGDDLKERTNAYQVRVDVGRPDIRHFNDWSLYFAYRYIERDAVLDAFTDSVFHQGGTDAKGWVLGLQYGLANNTWVNFRWFSTDAIDPPAGVNQNRVSPLGIDTATLDLWTRF